MEPAGTLAAGEATPATIRVEESAVVSSAWPTLRAHACDPYLTST
jgi:hypothetical protein